MPVLPTFDPQGQPGDIARAGMDAFVTSRNLMERAAQNRRAEEELSLRRQQFEVTLPVLRAQAQAQIATAGASLADARSRAEMEAKFAVDHVAAQDELNAIVAGAYTEAMPEGDMDAEQLKAFTEQEQDRKDARLAQWMTKYSYLAQVPAGKDLYQQADTERGQISKLRLGQMSMDALADRARITSEGRMVAEQLQQENENLRKQLEVGGRAGTATEREAGENNRTRYRALSDAATEFEKMALREMDPAIQKAYQQRAQQYRDQAESVLNGSSSAPSVSVNLSSGETVGTMAAPAAPTKYNAPIEVVQAIKDGRITREQGAQVLREQFGMK